jgi:hypothetical protein
VIAEIGMVRVFGPMRVMVSIKDIINARVSIRNTVRKPVSGMGV